MIIIMRSGKDGRQHRLFKCVYVSGKENLIKKFTVLLFIVQLCLSDNKSSVTDT